MEMTAVWKERKSKRSFPLFPHRLRKLANNRQLPTFPQLRRRLGFLYLQARLTSTLTKSVTYMPGTFCYRHARSHPIENTSGFSRWTTSFVQSRVSPQAVKLRPPYINWPFENQTFVLIAMSAALTRFAAVEV